MAVIHTSCAIMKVLDPNSVITIKADQMDMMAWKNASLAHVGCFGNKAAQDQAAKT
jgi:hypothetical protein